MDDSVRLMNAPDEFTPQKIESKDKEVKNDETVSDILSMLSGGQQNNNEK